MRKLLSIICTLPLLLAFVFFTACNDSNKGLVFVKANHSKDIIFSEGVTGYKNSKTAYEIIADDYTSASLDYEFRGAKKGKLYEISCYVNILDYAVENPDGKTVVIYSKSDEDINSEIVYSNTVNSNTEDIDNNSDGWVKLKKIVMADSSNIIKFSVVLGWDDNKSKGSYYVDCVNIKPVSEISTYKTFKSNDKSIEMLFYTSDINNYCENEESLYDYINKISEYRKELINFTGVDFTEGKSVFLFTENQDKFGYAGVPIYISRNNAKDILASVDDFKNKNCDEYTYGLLHEISHTFDRICGEAMDKRWLFDSEFWADFKVACLLEKNHYLINDEKVLNYYKEENYLDNGLYTSEGLVCKLLEIINMNFDKNYQTLSTTFKRLNESDDNPISMNNYKKFISFVHTFEECGNINISDSFSDKEWKTVVEYFKNN